MESGNTAEHRSCSYTGENKRPKYRAAFNFEYWARMRNRFENEVEPWLVTSTPDPDTTPTPLTLRHQCQLTLGPTLRHQCQAVSSHIDTAHVCTVAMVRNGVNGVKTGPMGVGSG